MKKVIKFIRNNILGLLVGLSLCLNGVIIAENMITSEQVSYSNDKTSETIVKGNLDELFSAVDINERLGTTDISSIGDGTIAGAISSVNDNLTTKAIIEAVSLDSIINTVNTDLISTFSLIRGSKISSSDSTKTGAHYELILNVSFSTAHSNPTSTALFSFKNITVINYQIVGTLVPRTYSGMTFDLFVPQGKVVYAISDIPAGNYVLKMSFIATS